MKQLLLFIFLFVKLQFVHGQMNQLNIDTCQKKAKANYPLIKQYDLITKLTEYTVSNANKAYLPNVSLTGIAGYIIGGLPTITPPGETASEQEKFQMIGIMQINQTIWDGGATKTQKEIDKANSEVEKANIEVSMHSIRERVNELYFGILVIDEQLKHLEILNENLNHSYDKIKLTKEGGLAYQSDVDEVKAEILNLEIKKIEFIYARRGYLDMLAYMIGEQLNEQVQLEKPFVLESLESLANNRPELSMYARQQQLIEAQSSIGKVNNMPKIGLIGAGVLIGPGINLGASEFDNIAIAGLSLSWNTAGIYRNSNNKKLDKIRIDILTNQKDVFSFSNNLQLIQAKAEIEKQKAIILKEEEIVKLKSEIKKSYQLKYDNGMSSMNDLINAMNNENEAISNQSLHNVQLLMSIYNYKTISGN